MCIVSFKRIIETNEVILPLNHIKKFFCKLIYVIKEYVYRFSYFNLKFQMI